MSRTSAGIVLTQEVKLPEGYPCEAAEQAARSGKWKLAIEPCHITIAGGKSAGTSVATRSYIMMTRPKAVEATQGSAPPRALRYAEGSGHAQRGGVHGGSPYCFSMVGQGGITANCILDLLESMAFTLSGLVGPWLLGGDWNCTPAELEATGWVKKMGGVIHAPQAATCNGKVYDSFVVAATFSQHVQGT